MIFIYVDIYLFLMNMILLSLTPKPRILYDSCMIIIIIFILLHHSMIPTPFPGALTVP